MATPSSSKRRRAVFAPTPGTRVTSIRVGGNFAFSFTAAGISPVSEQRVDLFRQGLADAGDLGRPTRRRQVGDRDRAFADRLRRRAVGEHAVFDRAIELVEHPELLEGGGDLGVGHSCKLASEGLFSSRSAPSIASPPQMPASKPERGPAWLVLPTYEEASNIERLVAAARDKLPADAQVLIVDDNSADGTGRDRRRARRARGVGPLPPPRAQGRPRPRLHRRLPPRARRRRRPGDRDGRRLLARARLPAAPARGCRAGRHRDRLALRARRRGQRLGRAAAGDQQGGQHLRAARPRASGCGT